MSMMFSFCLSECKLSRTGPPATIVAIDEESPNGRYWSSFQDLYKETTQVAWTNAPLCSILWGLKFFKVKRECIWKWVGDYLAFFFLCRILDSHIGCYWVLLGRATQKQACDFPVKQVECRNPVQKELGWKVEMKYVFFFYFSLWLRLLQRKSVLAHVRPIDVPRQNKIG